MIELSTRRATVSLGRRLARALRGGDLVVLEGDLGAGKTFLARAICRALGVPREVTVASPTFSLVHEYEITPRVLHADLYRLDDPRDVGELGLREARAEGALVLAEWAGRFVGELGGDALVITLGVETSRRATLTATGPRGHELARMATSDAP